MITQGPQYPADAWDEAINKLLDGSLDEASAEELKSAATKDTHLALAIVDAWQLQKSMDELQLERAPASLRRKLKRIPRENRVASHSWAIGLPRWVLAGGMAAMVVAAIALTIGLHGGAGPQPAAGGGVDAAKLARTRRELATAFHYLDKVGLRVGREIHEELNDGLSAPIKENLYKHLPYTGQSQKEKRA